MVSRITKGEASDAIKQYEWISHTKKHFTNSVKKLHRRSTGETKMLMQETHQLLHQTFPSTKHFQNALIEQFWVLFASCWNKIDPLGNIWNMSWTMWLTWRIDYLAQRWKAPRSKHLWDKNRRLSTFMCLDVPRLSISRIPGSKFMRGLLRVSILEMMIMECTSLKH